VVYLSTKRATSFGERRGVLRQIVRWLTSGLNANPDYVNELPLVRRWIVEFGDDGLPWRELGLDDSGSVIVAGPDSRNYGFWNDTNMTVRDFVGDEIAKEFFESEWHRFYASRPARVPATAVPNASFQRTATPPLN